jgi:UDP-N-acetylglucosamine--N-acetylmuramyl-(pentapeptide) pyrophosphoryl-undecaprenol N-acetylglucosamine transferase
MKYIISGGGTGGHIFPAVAIANEIMTRNSKSEILFIGALGKMEMEKVPKAGYKIVGLPVVGFNRSNLLSNIGFPIKLIQSLFKAYKVVKDFKPDAVVGVGGFASGPTLAMANLLGIPTLIQEQNSYAGVTNKLLSKKAQKICVAYPNMERFFPAEKIVFTGNPVRSDIFQNSIHVSTARTHFNLDPSKKTLLVIGGSLGAKSINVAVKDCLSDIIKADVQLIWQTGKNFITEANEAVMLTKSKDIFVSEFIYDMPQAYAAADWVLSRAGALSVSEISVLNKAAILVPYPLAAEDHQTENAKTLSSKNAAILIKDQELGQKLKSTLFDLIENPAKSLEMSKQIQAFSKPNAAKEIVDQLLTIIKK